MEATKRKKRTSAEVFIDDFGKLEAPDQKNTSGRSERVDLLADLAELLSGAELDNLMWLINRSKRNGDIK